MLEPSGPFRPRFAVEDVGVLAGEYRYPDDTAARGGPARRERGYLTRADVRVIGCWKTNNRLRSALGVNDEAAVREATSRALDPATAER